jgi:nitrite reductase (NADH) small subunit
MTLLSQPTSQTWCEVVPLDDLIPDRGVAALVDGRQVAVFLLGDGTVHAIDTRDPVSQANVMSRGLVGDRAGVPVVASPLYKQCFAFDSGRCLDDGDHAVAVHQARVVDGRVHVRIT